MAVPTVDEYQAWSARVESSGYATGSANPQGKAVHFFVTWNNPPCGTYSAETVKAWLDEKWTCWSGTHGAVWWYGQLEVGENGTPHLQFAASFERQKRQQAVANIFGNGHGSRSWVKARTGTISRVMAYCGKQESRLYGPWEFGTRPAEERTASASKKKKATADDILKLIEAGASMRDVMVAFPNEFLHHSSGLYRMFFAMRAEQCAEPRLGLRVIWLHGDTGVGKTKMAFREAGGYNPRDVFVLSKDETGGPWWDGYEMQPTVIFDEFGDDWCSYKQLLRMLDVNPYRGPVKGNFVWLAATKIVITSVAHPITFYPKVTDKRELMRRIHEIREVAPATVATATDEELAAMEEEWQGVDVPVLESPGQAAPARSLSLPDHELAALVMSPPPVPASQSPAPFATPAVAPPTSPLRRLPAFRRPLVVAAHHGYEAMHTFWPDDTLSPELFSPRVYNEVDDSSQGSWM